MCDTGRRYDAMHDSSPSLIQGNAINQTYHTGSWRKER
jgi:hypothetical protein